MGGIDLNARVQMGDTDIDPIAESKPVAPPVRMVENALLDARRSADKPPELNPLLTGFDNVDLYLDHLGRKEVTIVASDSGVGKSTVITQLTYHVAASGHGALYGNLEMPEDAYCIRTVANFAKVKSKHARANRLTPEEMQRMETAYSDIFECVKGRLVLAGREHRELSAFRKYVEEAKRFLASRGVELRLVVVDHILETIVTGKVTDKELVHKMRSDFLRDMANDLDLHVIAIAHVTREGTREGQIPSKNNIAGSAWYDRAADNIVIFHQSREKDGTFKPNEPALFICPKCRWGEPFSVELNYKCGFFYPWSLKPRTGENPFLRREEYADWDEDAEANQLLHNQKHMR